MASHNEIFTENLCPNPAVISAFSLTPLFGTFLLELAWCNEETHSGNPDSLENYY
jgi:hypothetical protein